MKNISRITILGLVMLVCVGWLLNCKGVSSVNANSQETDTYLQKISYSDWIVAPKGVNTRLFDLPVKSFEYKNLNLSPQKIEEGELFVYIKLDGGQIRTLPFTQENKNLRFDYTVPQTQTLRLVTISMDGTPQEEPSFKFRYVLVPKELTSKMKINMLSYDSVQESLSLPE